MLPTPSPHLHLGPPSLPRFSPHKHLKALDGAGAILILHSLALLHHVFSDLMQKTCRIQAQMCPEQLDWDGWVCYGARVLQLIFSHPIVWGALGGGFASSYKTALAIAVAGLGGAVCFRSKYFGVIHAFAIQEQ